jgi:hypothetical protein
MPTKHIVSVYLDNGVVCEYEVASPDKGREHAAAIIKTGYRSTGNGSTDLEWYPPHRIEKVKVSGAAESTKYRDKKRAT